MRSNHTAWSQNESRFLEILRSRAYWLPREVAHPPFVVRHLPSTVRILKACLRCESWAGRSGWVRFFWFAMMRFVTWDHWSLFSSISMWCYFTMRRTLHPLSREKTLFPWCRVPFDHLRDARMHNRHGSYPEHCISPLIRYERFIHCSTQNKKLANTRINRCEHCSLTTTLNPFPQVTEVQTAFLCRFCSHVLSRENQCSTIIHRRRCSIAEERTLESGSLEYFSCC